MTRSEIPDVRLAFAGSVRSGHPGSGAVVAHLLWGQAVGGSNPPSPTRGFALARV